MILDLTKSNVLFRVDSYDQIGLGHIKRCAALASALQERGVNSTFVCFSEDSAVKAVLDPLKVEVIRFDDKINENHDLASTLNLLMMRNIEIVIIDSYAVDKNYLEAFRKVSGQVAYFEDYGVPDWPVDIVINGLIGSEKLNYRNKKTFLGTKHLILGEEYWNLFQDQIPDLKANEFLITVGGIDHFDLMSKCLDLLSEIDQTLKIHCVIGPYFENEKVIESAVARNPHWIKLHRQPGSLSHLIKQCNLAISAGGMTLYELAAHGVPSIGIIIWENQRMNVEKLGEAGVIIPLSYTDGPEFKSNLGKTIKRLAGNLETQKKLQQAGKTLVDGQGARRVAKALAEAVQ